MAVATGDLRTISPEQLERTQGADAQDRRGAACRTPRPRSRSATAIRRCRRPKAIASCSTMYDAVSRDLGFGPVTAVDPRRAGAADVSFAADHVEMAIDGIGLLGGGNHTPDEVRGPAHVPDPDAASGCAAAALEQAYVGQAAEQAVRAADAARLPGNTCSSSPLSAAPRCVGEHALHDRAQIERRPQVAAFVQRAVRKSRPVGRRRARPQPHRRRGNAHVAVP